MGENDRRSLFKSLMGGSVRFKFWAVGLPIVLAIAVAATWMVTRHNLAFDWRCFYRPAAIDWRDPYQAGGTFNAPWLYWLMHPLTLLRWPVDYAVLTICSLLALYLYVGSPFRFLALVDSPCRDPRYRGPGGCPSPALPYAARRHRSAFGRYQAPRVRVGCVAPVDVAGPRRGPRRWGALVRRVGELAAQCPEAARRPLLGVLAGHDPGWPDPGLDRLAGAVQYPPVPGHAADRSLTALPASCRPWLPSYGRDEGSCRRVWLLQLRGSGGTFFSF